MQKISRIYLGNCGFPLAWYDGQIFDLTDPESHQADDTIINLDNGGGKTSLLSLIFSCFETSQDRFLKHLQSKNNHFSQYFSNDGLPGFILVEWVMPARVIGGTPYRLVVGQVVSIKVGNDSPESDRIFFSFESTDDLKLESVPAPKLGATTVATIAEFSRWIHDEQKKHPDVYIARKQADWQRHLRERLIDLEMLQMQVNFSIQEGGFDTGFLNFSNETAFLQKFFHLTMDAQRASAVRDAVAAACDKLRRKPYYQAKLNELNKFRGVLHIFSELAHDYRRSWGDQAAILVAGARYAIGLQARALSRRQQQVLELGYEKDQTAIAASAAADGLSYSRQTLTMSSVMHLRAVAAAKANTAQAETALQAAINDIVYVKAARLLEEIETQDGRLAELEAQAELAKEGLKPFHDHAMMQGALLRYALHQGEKSLALTQERIARETVARNGQVKLHRDAIAADDKLHKDKTREQIDLQGQEKRFHTERARLALDGSFLNEQETGSEAVARWEQSRQQLLREEQAYRIEAGQHELQEKTWREEEVKLVGELGRLSVEIVAMDTFIAEGNAERERLSQLKVLALAAEADTADPDSPALPASVERLIAASAIEVSLADVRLAELRATKQSIDETGVAGNGPEVAHVVMRLQQAGLRSARPYNEYVADLVPKADAARALVLSDPARFFGVSVAQSELDKARGVDWLQDAPERPVVISALTLEASATAGDRIVVPSSTDAPYNREAAQALASTLAERIGTEETRRKDYYERQSDGLAAVESLRTYFNRFGQGKLNAAGIQRLDLEQRQTLAGERKAQASTAAADAVAAAKASREAAVERQREAKDAQVHEQAVGRFSAEYETTRADRLEKLAQLQAVLEDLEVRRDALEQVVRELETESLEQQKVAYRAESQAAGLSKERANLEFYDKELHAEELLRANPAGVEDLRARYEDAKDIYKTNSRDRLGVLDAQMESARRSREEKRTLFNREYPKVTPANMAPFKSADYDSLLSEFEAQRVKSQGVHASALTAEGGVKTMSADWHKKHREVAAATPDIEALDDVTLEGRRDEAFALAATAAERQERATQESVRAKEKAKALLASAAQEDRLATLIKTTMKLDESPSVELLILEVANVSGQPPIELDSLPPLVLEEDASDQATRVVQEFSGKANLTDKAREKARTAFDSVKKASTEPELQKVEPELAAAMLSNEFNAACSDANRLLEGLDDRIGTTKDNLEKMQTDFDACVEEMVGLSRVGLNLLNSAMEKKVPAGAPYVAGKAVLKMRANFSTINLDARRQALTHYLDGLIQANVMPAKGSDLVAEAILRMYGGRPLGLQVLRMVIDESQQYTPVDKISNSGGEGVVMALFLYVVITQLRAETQAKLHRLAGGPLILDNPFAKATSPTMWRAQRLLAQSMGVQLVFATAIQDYNALAEFASFVRLRRAGQNSKTGRWHLEVVRYHLNDEPPPNFPEAGNDDLQAA